MATQPVTHVLALAAANFRQADAALTAQDRAAAIDTDLDALGTLTTRAQLEALAHRVGAAAGHEYGSAKYYRQVRAWERDAYSRIRARPLVLFPAGAAWIDDLHGPTTP